VKEHAGCVDQRGVSRFAGSSQRVEDFAFECLARVGSRVLRNDVVGDSPTEAVDGGAAGFDGGPVAVLIGGGAEGRKVEQAMNRRDVPVTVVHADYSIVTASRRHRWS
jgi:hypothetical protein